MEVGAAQEGELIDTLRHVADGAQPAQALRSCEMGCGASGTPEPGYRIFVCPPCLDATADYLETAAARERIERMPSHSRMLFEFRFD